MLLSKHRKKAPRQGLGPGQEKGIMGDGTPTHCMPAKPGHQQNQRCPTRLLVRCQIWRRCTW